MGITWHKSKPSEVIRVIDSAYAQYLNWVKNNKKAKSDNTTRPILVHLGKLWAIRELSYFYIPLGEEKLKRSLAYGQIRHLDEINKICMESALNTWESYFINPTNFTLDLFETFQYVFRILREQEIGKSINVVEIQSHMQSDYYLLNIIKEKIISDNGKIISEQIKMTRSSARPAFYLTCLILTLAIVFGWVALSGLGESVQFTVFKNWIEYLVAIPVMTSVFGLILTLWTVIYTVR